MILLRTRWLSSVELLLERRSAQPRAGELLPTAGRFLSRDQFGLPAVTASGWVSVYRWQAACRA